MSQYKKYECDQYFYNLWKKLYSAPFKQDEKAFFLLNLLLKRLVNNFLKNNHYENQLVSNFKEFESSILPIFFNFYSEGKCDQCCFDCLKNDIVNLKSLESFIDIILKHFPNLMKDILNLISEKEIKNLKKIYKPKFWIKNV